MWIQPAHLTLFIFIPFIWLIHQSFWMLHVIVCTCLYQTEKSVLDKHVSMENSNESPLVREPPSRRNDIKSSLTIPQRSMLQRMKSLTNASEDVCVSVLQKRSFDLNSSIDAYFAGERWVSGPVIWMVQYETLIGLERVAVMIIVVVPVVGICIVLRQKIHWMNRII